MKNPLREGVEALSESPEIQAIMDPENIKRVVQEQLAEEAKARLPEDCQECGKGGRALKLTLVGSTPRGPIFQYLCHDCEPRWAQPPAGTPGVRGEVRR